MFNTSTVRNNKGLTHSWTDHSKQRFFSEGVCFFQNELLPIDPKAETEDTVPEAVSLIWQVRHTRTPLPFATSDLQSFSSLTKNQANKNLKNWISNKQLKNSRTNAF